MPSYHLSLKVWNSEVPQTGPDVYSIGTNSSTFDIGSFNKKVSGVIANGSTFTATYSGYFSCRETTIYYYKRILPVLETYIGSSGSANVKMEITLSGDSNSVPLQYLVDALNRIMSESRYTSNVVTFSKSGYNLVINTINGFLMSGTMISALLLMISSYRLLSMIPKDLSTVTIQELIATLCKGILQAGYSTITSMEHVSTAFYVYYALSNLSLLMHETNVEIGNGPVKVGNLFIMQNSGSYRGFLKRHFDIVNSMFVQKIDQFSSTVLVVSRIFLNQLKEEVANEKAIEEKLRQQAEERLKLEREAMEGRNVSVINAEVPAVEEKKSNNAPTSVIRRATRSIRDVNNGR